MSRRSRAGGKSLKQGRKRSAPKRRNALKATRNSGASIAGQETVVARLTYERDEALLRETANVKILRLISKSPSDLELVFRAILEDATRICNANFGTLFRFDGSAFHLAARLNTPAALADFQKQRGPFLPVPGVCFERMMRTKRVCSVVDDAAEPVPSLAARLGGARSLVCVPMLKDDALIGALAIYRQEVRPFTEKQIALLTNFAAQAVIAIENARLLNELRESLEQQTATSEVLKIISSSPGDLKPVFDAILENATSMCEAKFGTLLLTDGDVYRNVAMHNVPPAFAELRQREPDFRPGPDTALDRVARTKQVAQIEDARTDHAYIKKPVRATLVELGGARTYVAVPMLKDNVLIGAIGIYRQEVRPFTDKQIELVKNFAAQAVIAMENARLLNDLNKLNQQLEQRVADQVSEIERMSRLRRFLPPQVADLIVASGAEKQLESHRREITALFCDLRGFTGFSEASDPEDVMALLREYHAAIGQIIIKYS